jgi:serine/threonine-protein kinase
LESGTLLSDYKILQRIEANGASESYLAERTKDRAVIKLQTFSSRTFESGVMAGYYLDAMKQWLAVSQPNISRVLEAGHSSTGTFYAASALIPGNTLEDRLWQSGAVELKPAIYLAISISKVLEWLWNEHGLIYGQLTPRNIVLTPDRDICLNHMALAPILRTRPDGISFREFVTSTPGFTCPEHFTAPESMDCRGDMYSLGATLYHMLTGKPPFACLNEGEVLSKHQSPSLADPRILRPDLPDEFVWLLEILLAHDPKDRFDNWPYLIKILSSLDFRKSLSKQKSLKSHSVLIRLPPSDLAKLPHKPLLQPAQTLYPSPAAPAQKDYLGIIIGTAIFLSAILIIIIVLLLPS